MDNTFLILGKMVELQEAILDNDYYVSLYNKVLERHGVTIGDVSDECITPTEAITICHTFWTVLPDSKSIRREPFYKLCELAEYIYDVDVEES